MFKLKRVLRVSVAMVFLLTAIVFNSFQPVKLDTTFPLDNLTCKEIINKMLLTIETTTSIKFHLKITERIKGKMINSESKSKLNKSPRKIYISLKGPELLWVEGENKGNALVNPDGFPYINLNLDPMGAIMRENQHHTIHEMGFDYLAGILKFNIKNVGDKFGDYFKCYGEVIWNNRKCYQIIGENPEFRYLNYTVKKNETIITIARALHVGEYMILEANADVVDDYDDVKPGQVIKVPSIYARKTILLVDKQYMVPINTKIYDDKGLYESYEYVFIEVNPKFAPQEFTKTFEGYGF